MSKLNKYKLYRYRKELEIRRNKQPKKILEFECDHETSIDPIKLSTMAKFLYSQKYRGRMIREFSVREF